MNTNMNFTKIKSNQVKSSFSEVQKKKTKNTPDWKKDRQKNDKRNLWV